MTLEELEKKFHALEAKNKKLEKRVQEMEDAEAIRQMHTEYIYNLSNWEFDKMQDCFTDDAVEEIHPGHQHTGISEIKKVFDEFKKNPPQKGGHMLIQPVISVKGDKAEGHWIMYRLNYYFTGPSGQIINMFGPHIQRKYECEYRKEKGKWKFSNLKFIDPWPDPDPRYEKSIH
jgi:ketosteroid isomerase-like protein